MLGLVRCRMAATLSQRELAAIAGVSHVTIASLEGGHDAHPRTQCASSPRRSRSNRPICRASHPRADRFASSITPSFHTRRHVERHAKGPKASRASFTRPTVAHTRRPLTVPPASLERPLGVTTDSTTRPSCRRGRSMEFRSDNLLAGATMSAMRMGKLTGQASVTGVPGSCARNVRLFRLSSRQAGKTGHHQLSITALSCLLSLR